MKISRFLLPAVTLAGALALAGCGGDGDPMEEMDDMEMSDADADADADGDADMDDDKTDMGDGSKSLRLPDGTSINWAAVGRGGPIEIAAGSTRVLDGVYFTCSPDGADCTINAGSGERISITYTGGTLTPSETDPTVMVPKTSQAGSDHWLSAANIVAAVPADGTANLSVTIGNVKHQIAALKSTPSSAGSGTPDAKVDKLTLRHDRADATDPDFLVWGTWEEPAAPGVGNKPKHHQVWGGSKVYDVTPSTQLETATYAHPGGAHGFYKRGSGSWTHWVGDPTLTANFGKGVISGMITPTTAGVTQAGTGVNVGGVASIKLGETAIGSTMSGSVTLTGGASVENAPSSGSWEAGFFGSTSEAPTGIAGGFNAERKAAAMKMGAPNVAHGAVGSFHINGAFAATSP